VTLADCKIFCNISFNYDNCLGYGTMNVPKKKVSKLFQLPILKSHFQLEYLNIQVLILLTMKNAKKNNCFTNLLQNTAFFLENTAKNCKTLVILYCKILKNTVKIGTC
jgi:hypothetical protein